MKKSLSFIFLGLIVLSTHAQKKPGTYWKTIGGLKAGVNNSNIRFGSGTPTGSTSDAWSYGFTGGFWASMPLGGDKASFQPELVYSGMGGNATFPGSLAQYTTYSHYDLKSGYLSIPLLLKYHHKNLFALYAGPQFGFLMSGKADVTRNNSITNVDLKDSMNTTDISFAGGIQLFPRGKVHLDVRYIYGVNNFWENKPGNYFNQAFQFTIGVRLFGKKITILPPDSDNDGIYDKEDKCPTVPGVLEYQGCPIPDTDGDGINDKEDKCPTVAGTREYQGCPIPDTDGDGINDKEDKCPTLAGTRENQGCPAVAEEIKKKVVKAANDILFITGSYKLAAKSYKGLDEVVKILKANPDMLLSIDGHTDNVGNDEYNQTLSDNRAGAIKTYFISKGITEDRITSAGHGETSPIADNKTAAGRAKNRRVEMKLSYYR